MQIDLLDFITETLRHAGIQVLLLDGSSQQMMANIDYGFRHKMTPDFDYSFFLEKMKLSLEEGVQYYFEDDLKLCYCLFRFPSGTGLPDSLQILSIGPIMPRVIDTGTFRSLLDRQKVPLQYHQDFLEFYNRIPIVSDLDTWNHSLNFALEKLAGTSVPYRIISMDSIELFALDYKDYAIPDYPGIASNIIEERYEWEEKMLSAVAAGNLKEAAEAHYHFLQYKLLPRSSDPVRDKKNILFTFNAILRKAVQAGHVHPLHIDNLSRQFAIQIENTFTLEQLHSLSQTMLRKYCMLVNNYSRQANSLLVRSCMDYIDFHYIEELSLGILAQKHSVSASYLSGLFKKETDMTITDYINTTRIRQALILLNTTSMSVGAIASRCGFPDSNYFTRTFKKHQGITPRAYRESIGKAAG